MNKLLMMKAFTSVVTEGSFHKAADRMNLSPQLVSKYVSQLESDLKTRLLTRTTRKINLTEAGHIYLQRCQQVLLDIEEMESSLTDLQNQVTGTLNISAPMSFGIHHLSEPIAEFQSRYPSVNVQLFLTDQKVNLLEANVDIALRIGNLKNSSLIGRKIAPIRMVTCASPQYLAEHGEPKTAEDLSQHRYLRYSYSEGREITASWGEHSPFSEQNTHLVSNNGDILINAAIRHQGIAIQPTFLTYNAVARGELVVLEQFPLQMMGLYAVYPNRQFLASKIRHFIDFISGYYGELPYWDKPCDSHPSYTTTVEQ